MKEPYRKGLATHPDPESCAGGGNIAGEALTGAHAGQPSSSEITSIGVPTLCLCGEGNMSSDGTREPLQDAAESKTLRMRGNSLHGNRETPRPPPPMLAEDGPRRLLPYVGHVRPRGVGRSHIPRTVRVVRFLDLWYEYPCRLSRKLDLWGDTGWSRLSSRKRRGERWIASGLSIPTRKSSGEWRCCGWSAKG